MKKFNLLIVLTLLSIFSSLSCKAQSSTAGPDVGGLWCYVDVDLKHDPTERGWAYYELLTPIPNGDRVNLQPGGEVLCMGPGRPRLVERDGSTFLKLLLSEVELDIMGVEYGTAYVEVNTTTLVTVLGEWLQPALIPKYYTIQPQIKNTDW